MLTTLISFVRCFFFFFFQAEDGIRDPLVTGVQTCALPISRAGVGCESDDLAAMCAVGLEPREKADVVTHADLLGQRSDQRVQYTPEGFRPGVVQIEQFGTAGIEDLSTVLEHDTDEVLLVAEVV